MNADGDSNSPRRNSNTDNIGRMLTHIESLPVELIQKIFLLSLNVNLPRASPYLAAALSNEGVYKVLILLAFWDVKAVDKRDYDGVPITSAL